jgi:hypothetical protein
MKRLKQMSMAMVMVISIFATGVVMAGGAVQFKFGAFLPEGGGQFWDDTEAIFRHDAGDFEDFTFGFSYVSALGNHMEVGLNIDFYDAHVFSAYRDYIDEDGFQIFHDTSLSMIPVSADIRILPFGRFGGRGNAGRIQVRQPVFYFGGGIGMNFFEYEEIGDFVDFTSDEIFFDHFQDSGVSFSTHVLAGIEIPISPTMGLMFEGKQTWTDEELGSDFSGLGELELGGTTFFGGITYNF